MLALFQLVANSTEWTGNGCRLPDIVMTIVGFDI